MTQKKRMLSESVAALAAWEFEGNFDNIRAKLQELQDKHPQYEVLVLEFDIEYEYGDSSTVINITGQREETDADRAKTNLEQAQNKALAKAQRLAQFEKLKQEFDA